MSNLAEPGRAFERTGSAARYADIVHASGHPVGLLKEEVCVPDRSCRSKDFCYA
jgi:hypothetical protein